MKKHILGLIIRAFFIIVIPVIVVCLIHSYYLNNPFIEVDFFTFFNSQNDQSHTDSVDKINKEIFQEKDTFNVIEDVSGIKFSSLLRYDLYLKNNVKILGEIINKNDPPKKLSDFDVMTLSPDDKKIEINFGNKERITKNGIKFNQEDVVMVMSSFTAFRFTPIRQENFILPNGASIVQKLGSNRTIILFRDLTGLSYFMVYIVVLIFVFGLILFTNKVFRFIFFSEPHWINKLKLKNMENQQPNEIKITDNFSGGEYANAMQVSHTKEEFIMTFFNIIPPSGRVCGKIITSPGHVKRMIDAMTDNLKKYQEKFGPVEPAEEPKPEIGFKV